MKDILIALRRNPYQNFASLLVLTLSSFFIISFVFMLLFFTALLTKIETLPQVTIYFKPDTPTETIAKLKEEIANTFKVTEINFITQSQALEIYKQIFEGQESFTSLVTENMLPPSLEIKTNNPENLYQIAEYAKTKPGVDEVDFQRSIVDTLLKFTKTLRRFTLISAVVIFTITLIILISIITFKVAIRRDIIETLKLLGASNFFVIKPLLIENLIIAVISSTLSFLLFTGIILYLKPFVNNYFATIGKLQLTLNSYTITVWPITTTSSLIILALALVFTVTSASLATLISAKKYIK
ncbi:MAG: cell division protein FtsX [Patescibacteria group bacterium]|nr:MAG: cell division protein FtsX [Patescibacteria group bacterium]